MGHHLSLAPPNQQHFLPLHSLCFKNNSAIQIGLELAAMFRAVRPRMPAMRILRGSQQLRTPSSVRPLSAGKTTTSPWGFSRDATLSSVFLSFSFFWFFFGGEPFAPTGVWSEVFWDSHHDPSVDVLLLFSASARSCVHVSLCVREFCAHHQKKVQKN